MSAARTASQGKFSGFISGDFNVPAVSLARQSTSPFGNLLDLQQSGEYCTSLQI